jgi:5-methylcytosine-specific restriction protein A
VPRHTCGMPTYIDWTRDEVILAADIVRDNGWKMAGPTDPRVMALSGLLRATRDPLPYATFRNPNGVGRKTADIATQHPNYTGKPTKGGSLDQPVLLQFLADPFGMKAEAATIRAAMATVPGVLTGVPEDDPDYLEGGVVLVSHKRRERNPKLRRDKLKAVRATGQPLVCEVCGRDVDADFGAFARADSMVDIHHVTWLSDTGRRSIKLKDVIVVCPTCHRALHRANPRLAPDELRTKMVGC